MMLKQGVVYLKKNCKSFFCYSLILLGVLFNLILLIAKPMKINTEYVYQYNNKITKEEFQFPILQHVRFHQDNLKLLNVFLRASSVSGKSYRVKLLDKSGNEYYSSDFVFDDSSVISISLENLGLEKNFDYILEIECESCSSSKLSLKKSNNDDIYLEGLDGKTLEMTVHYASKNNSYYWYSAMVFAIALTLLPIAKGEENEKD